MPTTTTESRVLIKHLRVHPDDLPKVEQVWSDFHYEKDRERREVLRQAVVAHLTPRFELKQNKIVPPPTCGATLALLVDGEGRELMRAEALCSPWDQFNRRIGRDIALGRLAKKMQGAA